MQKNQVTKVRSKIKQVALRLLLNTTTAHNILLYRIQKSNRKRGISPGGYAISSLRCFLGLARANFNSICRMKASVDGLKCQMFRLRMSPAWEFRDFVLFVGGSFRTGEGSLRITQGSYRSGSCRIRKMGEIHKFSWHHSKSAINACLGIPQVEFRWYRNFQKLDGDCWVVLESVIPWRSRNFKSCRDEFVVFNPPQSVQNRD